MSEDYRTHRLVTVEPQLPPTGALKQAIFIFGSIVQFLVFCDLPSSTNHLSGFSVDLLCETVSRRERVGRRAERAPYEGRTLASDFPRERRLHYPHYATMYEHTPSDPQKRRHETIRSIYLWNVPPEKRADRPRESAARQKNFETKYRHVLKERADHEWSRTYYYPPLETKASDSSSSSLVDRLLNERREELAAYVPPSRAKKEAAASSSISPRSYAKDSSSSRDSAKESPRERQKPVRTEINHPAVEASRASRRLNSYLDRSETTSRSSRRYDRNARQTEENGDSIASSSSATSNGRSSHRYERSRTEDSDVADEKVEKVEKVERRSRASSSSSSAPLASNERKAEDVEVSDDDDDIDVDAIVAEVMANADDLSDDDETEVQVAEVSLEVAPEEIAAE